MKIEEAKEWLSAYIPDEDLEYPPQMQEALRMAETDPELGKWLEQRLEMDAQLKTVLSEEPVPAGLRESLLQTVGQTAPAPQRKWFMQPWIMGMAAMLVLGLGTFVFIQKSEPLIQEVQTTIAGKAPEDFGEFRDGMAFYIRNMYFQLDHLSDELPSIESWIENSEGPNYETLPTELTALKPLGCKQLEWNDMPVTLVCFHTENQRIVHLFILDKEEATPAQYANLASVTRSSELETGGWTSGSRVYLLVGSHPEVDIEFALS